MFDWRRIVIVFLAVVLSAILGALAAFSFHSRTTGSSTLIPSTPPKVAEPVIPTVEIVAEDAHQQRMLEEIQSVLEWADGSGIYISEMGVPNNESPERYSRLIEKFFEVADITGIHVTPWAVGPKWGDYPVAPYNTATLEDNAISQAFNNHLGTDRYFRGLNLAGPEFGLGPDANGSVGSLGEEYSYFGNTEMWSLIAAKGYTHVRFPFRMERLFDVTTGELRVSDRAGLILALEKARLAGLQIILDPHNYGALQIQGQKQILGGEVFTANLYMTMMRNLAALSNEYSDVVSVIGLMNEPKNLEISDWEIYSQSALTTLRDAGWAGLIEVPTGKWQGAKDVANLHRKPWITDPLENFVYGVHQYYDWDSSGAYHTTYAQDEERIERKYKPRAVIFVDPR